jgi:hypothetical protein
MDNEDRKILKRLQEKVEENNSILRKLLRIEKWRRWTKIFYWLAIIALSFGAYYLIQPYIENLSGAYSGLTGNGGDGSGFQFKILQDVGDVFKGSVE